MEGLTRIPEVGHVVVVDNESDGTLRALLASSDPERVTVLESVENRGFGGGVNLGMAHPGVWSADVVLMINNDASIERADLCALIEELEVAPDVAMVAPLVLNPDGSLQDGGGRLVPALGLTRVSRRPLAEPDFLSWACVLLRGEAMREVGVLDDSYFMYWEDVDYALRTRRAGWKIRVTEKAAARHERSVSKARAGDLLKLYHSWGLARTARKYRGQWLIGLVLWGLGSMLAQAASLRLGRLRCHVTGLRRGWSAASPAYAVVPTRSRIG